MLSAALLNAAKYPGITLRSAGLRSSADGRAGDVVAQVLVHLDGRTHSVAVPMRYQIDADQVVASGEFPLKQTDLGLTPFNAVGGALRVRDGMTVRLRLVARPAREHTEPAAGRDLPASAPYAYAGRRE
jgi:polyisoprenoid-binding protein YceI